jgi:ABC-type phosphate/phosphonate transport system substrate-binding protein
MVLTMIKKLILCWLLTCLVMALYPDSGQTEKQKIFRMGVIADTFSGVNQNDARIALNVLLAKQLNTDFLQYKTETVIYPDIHAAIQDTKNGKLDLLTLPTMDYILARDQIQMKPEMISGVGPEKEQSYILLVNEGSNIKSLSQLNNKKLIVEKGAGGRLALKWIDTLLLEASLPESEVFFQEIKQVDKSSRALLPVFFGQADGCIVRNFTYETMVELNPQVGKKLLVLNRSPVLGSTLLCFHTGIENKLADSIINFIQKMPDHIEYRQVLLLFQVKQIFRYKPEYLHSLESLLHRYEELKQKSVKQ